MAAVLSLFVHLSLVPREVCASRLWHSLGIFMYFWDICLRSSHSIQTPKFLLGSYPFDYHCPFDYI